MSVTRTGSLALLTAFALGSPARAQQQDAQPTISSEEETSAEEILVTGRRKPLYQLNDVTAGALGSRELLDVPFSINAYGQDLIKAQRAQTFNDLLRNDPSVQNFNSGGTYDRVGIRGFTTDTVSSFRRDGLQSVTLTDVPFENVERFEVLKGVSGFLFGLTEPGGTINFVVKRPTADPFVTVDLEGRSYDGYYGHIDVGGPIPGTALGLRMNAAIERVGDFTHNRDQRREMVSGAVDWQPFDGMVLRFDGEYQHKNLAAQPRLPLTTAGTLIGEFDERRLFGAPWLTYEAWSMSLGFRGDFRISRSWTLTTQISYADLERDQAFPVISRLEPNGAFTAQATLAPRRNQWIKGLSHQTFVSGDFATGPLAHKIVAGVFTLNTDAVFGGFFNNPPNYTGNIFTPTAFPPVGVYTTTAAGLPTKRNQTHFFGSDSVSAGPVELIVGGRYINLERINTAGIYRKKTFTPSVAGILKVAKRARLYASYAKNLQEGGVAPNLPTITNPNEQLDPLESEQYEVGAKAEVLAGFNLAAAVFQITKPADYISGNRFGRFGKQVHKGFEFTASGQITRKLSFVGGFTLLDAELARNSNAALDGNRPANVAKFQGSAFADYQLFKGFAVNAGVFHVGARAVTSANLVEIPGYTRVDAGARYSFVVGRTPMVVRLNVNNIFDKFYWESAALDNVNAGMPREARVSLQMEF